MNVQSKYPTTPDEFLRWNEGREGKREFVKGRVVELMINVTKKHALISARLVAILMRTLQYPPFTVGTADFAVRTHDGIRFPDVFVDRDTPKSKGTDLEASEPLLLAEVLSPSSVGRDFVEKLSDYTAVETLMHYLIVSQDEPRAWLWSRAATSAWEGPVESSALESFIDLAGVGAVVRMDELYAGLVDRPGQ